MCRPFEDNCKEEMVDVETIFDNNEENEAGLKKKRRKHYSNDAFLKKSKRNYSPIFTLLR
ncbi:unnamed protein product [Tenebrio molitor]|nr:unnamed protein product [Tenebrio molitor]